jgi:glutathione S-transferase
MSFTLYNYVLSGNCYKVRLLASLLNVKYESVSVDFHPGQEHKSEPLLRLNPAGTLPILVINQSSSNGSSNGAGNDAGNDAGTGNDTVLTETQAMLVWLAQHHDSTNRWWPADDKNKIPLVMQWLGFASRLSATVGELRLHSMLNKTINVPAAKAGSKNALRELESRLTEQRIHDNIWLTGDTPTVADIACFPYAALSPDAGIEHDDYPALRSWLHAIRSLPGFVTIPGIYELHELRNPDSPIVRVNADSDSNMGDASPAQLEDSTTGSAADSTTGTTKAAK